MVYFISKNKKEGCIMDFLDNIIEQFGAQNIIIVGVSLLVIILVLLVYWIVKLKSYRKEIVDLENECY